MANVSLMQQLSGYLQLTNQRQQLIVSNMANIDTPGYHTQDLDFQGAMRQVADGGTVSVRRGLTIRYLAQEPALDPIRSASWYTTIGSVRSFRSQPCRSM